MKKFKDFIKKKDEFLKPPDCPDAFFGFIRKHKPRPKSDAFFGLKKDTKKLKEAHHDDEHYDDEDHHDYDEDHHEEDDESYYDHIPGHRELADHFHEEKPTYGYYGKKFKHYDDYDMSHIRDYTSSSFEMNHALVKDHKYTDHSVEGLSKALKKTSLPHDIEVHTGTKFSPERYVQPGQKKATVHLPAFTSTSIVHSVAKGFSGWDDKHPHIYMHDSTADWHNPKITKLEGEDLPQGSEKEFTYKHVERMREKYGPRVDIHRYGHVISMHVPKGTHGVYVGGHSDFTEHKDEHEFILHKGSYVELHHEPEIHHASKTIQWRGRLVHDGAKGEPKEKDPNQLEFPFMKRGRE